MNAHSMLHVADRQWQKDGLLQLTSCYAEGRRYFLAGACSGAGGARFSLAAFSIALALVVPMVPLPAKAQSFSFGPAEARAVDGDTIRAGETRIRLSAIDAPELSQRCRGAKGTLYLCGRDSRDFLAALIADGVECRVIAFDEYRRAVASCRAADGRDIGAVMVRAGHAVPYWKFGGAIYAAQEAQAKAATVGMYAGEWIAPDRWRRGDRWSAKAGH